MRIAAEGRDWVPREESLEGEGRKLDLPTTTLPAPPLDEEKSITLRGTPEEVAAVKAALFGVKWLRWKDGELDAKEAYEDTPQKTPDPLLWDHFPSVDNGVYLREGKFTDKHNSPSIFLSSIAGYGGREEYKRRAELLTKAGFVCLRSKRDKEGYIDELWHLWGTWHFNLEMLRGLFEKEAMCKPICLDEHGEYVDKQVQKIRKADQKKLTRLIVNWVLNEIRPGNLYVSGEAWGLGPPE